mgnify:CR=1 FL=1
MQSWIFTRYDGRNIDEVPAPSGIGNNNLITYATGMFAMFQLKMNFTLKLQFDI